MIITPDQGSGQKVRSDTRWMGLARRGMLWSEVQSYDLVFLERTETFVLGDAYYVELISVVEGHITVDAVEAREGEVCVMQAKCKTEARALTDRVRLLRIRVLPHRLTQKLPRRQPSLQLPPEPYAVHRPN